MHGKLTPVRVWPIPQLRGHVNDEIYFITGFREGWPELLMRDKTPVTGFTQAHMRTFGYFKEKTKAIEAIMEDPEYFSAGGEFCWMVVEGLREGAPPFSTSRQIIPDETWFRRLEGKWMPIEKPSFTQGYYSFSLG